MVEQRIIYRRTLGHMDKGSLYRSIQKFDLELCAFDDFDILVSQMLCTGLDIDQGLSPPTRCHGSCQDEDHSHGQPPPTHCPAVLSKKT